MRVYFPNPFDGTAAEALLPFFSSLREDQLAGSFPPEGFRPVGVRRFSLYSFLSGLKEGPRKALLILPFLPGFPGSSESSPFHREHPVNRILFILFSVLCGASPDRLVRLRPFFFPGPGKATRDSFSGMS